MTDEHLKALGRVTANQQTVELMVRNTTFSLFENFYPLAEIVFIGPWPENFSSLCKTSKRLFEYRHGAKPCYVKYDKLLARIDKCLKKRNGFVHGSWSMDETTKEVFCRRMNLTTMKTPDVASLPVPASEILSLADELQSIAIELSKLRIGMHETGVIPTIYMIPPDGEPPGSRQGIANENMQ